MQITRNSIETATGPADRFTGHVYVDAITAATPPSRLQAATVHFAPGARTAWHTHPNRQTIYVLQGIGRCQHRGGPIAIIGPGDRVFFEPEEDHRHGAAPDRFMIHLAMLEVDDNANSAIPTAPSGDLTSANRNTKPNQPARNQPPTVLTAHLA